MSTINPLLVATAKYANNSTVNAPINATTHVPERNAIESSSLLNSTSVDSRLPIEIVQKWRLDYTASRDPLQFIERVEDLSEAYGMNQNILPGNAIRNTTHHSGSALTQSSNPMPNETQVHPSPTSSTSQSNLSNTVATARVRIIAASGNSAEFRAIFDSGSQVNLVSERLIRKLGASTSETSLLIDGIGNGQKMAIRRISTKFFVVLIISPVVEEKELALITRIDVEISQLIPGLQEDRILNLPFGNEFPLHQNRLLRGTKLQSKVSQEIF
uniref:DUF1758 domain-containing protein n=1 Tax=Glossina austeni TaxID=7395 RepID=A0A1A9UDL1_GLOAU